MLISGPEGFKPIQTNKALRSVAASGGARVRRQDGYYDHFSLSAGSDSSAFRGLLSELSQEVRTCNTTGKIQDLHRQVVSGEYAVSPREIAARMLLMQEGE